MKKNFLFFLLACLIGAGNVAAIEIVRVFDFEDGIAFSGYSSSAITTTWNVQNAGGGISNFNSAAEAHTGNRSVRIIVGASSPNEWDSQLRSPTVTTVTGDYYEISFWVRSTAPGAGRISFDSGNQMTSQYLSTFTTSTAWKKVVFNPTTTGGGMKAGTDTNMHMNFDMGKTTNVTYYIDDIQVINLSAGSVTVTPKVVLDFNDIALGTVMPSICYNPGDATSTIEVDPDPAGKNVRSLHHVSTNYDSGFRLNGVTFDEEGYTLRDVVKMTANVYLLPGGDMTYKKIEFWFGEVGTPFAAKGHTTQTSGWKIEGNASKRESWETITVTAAEMGLPGLSGDLLDLNVFDMGIGVGDQTKSVDFYWDNITFEFAPKVIPAAPLVIPAGKTKTIFDYTGGDITFVDDGTGVGQLDLGFQTLDVMSGVVKLEKKITKHGSGDKKWHAIGFPFDVASIRCDLVPYDLESYKEGVGGDFWLSAVNDEGNFVAVEEVSTLDAGEGYAIQFPDVLTNKVVTFTSVSNPTLSNSKDIISSIEGYAMVASPSVANINAGSLSCSANQHFYLFDGLLTFEHHEEVPRSLKPFDCLAVYTGTGSPARTLGIESGPTGLINAKADNGKIMNVRYYNLQGLEITQPVENNIYIVKTIYESNKVETTKVLFTK
ncbi:MAG: carbohydrate binding domain-containing protein [Dysgonamonadaceae bacterium]|jgi:hypothetical protein|nr:carbohydrate binding domain-containing protein [Dysgonamonadaceae bacterium]